MNKKYCNYFKYRKGKTMNAEIITIGSEILIGDILNTHAQFLSKQLNSIGIDVLWHSSVGDNKTRLEQILKFAISRSDLIFLTGGLGPTQDDITKQILSKTISMPLIEDATLKLKIKAKFKQKNIYMPQSNLKQAQIFEGSTIFENKNGTAPGIAIKFDGKTIILLPGPPNELVPMFENEIMPFLEKLTNCVIKSKNIYLYGITESQVDEKIAHILKNETNPSVGIYAKPEQIRLRITCKAQNENQCDNLIENMFEKIKLKLESFIYSTDEAGMEHALVKAALENNKKIAVAESCTGGLIASKIVSVKNASKCFNFAAVCYSNEMKEKILKVNHVDLEKFGAVSSQVAQQMAKSAQLISGADVAISTTGIADSGGENEKNKPIGLVFVGLATNEQTIAFKVNFHSDSFNQRKKIINSTSLFAMNIARKTILNLEN